MTLRMMTLCVALLLPLAASATHFTTVTAEADCQGWNIDAEISWRADVFEGELSYVVELRDAEDNVLETQQWTGLISRVDNPEITTMDGAWDTEQLGDVYLMTYELVILAPVDDGIPEHATGSIEFACDLVATESMSWSTVKALY